MAMASGLALPDAFRREARRVSDGLHRFEDLTGQHLSAGISEANEVCVSVAREFGTYIGIGVYNVFQGLNPDRVVLGGGLLNLPEIFFDTVTSLCYDKAKTMMYDRLEIKKGELGGNAGILGAVALLVP